MALVVTKAATLPSTPNLNALNWSAAVTRAGRDPTTGDLWNFRSDGSATAISLYTSQDNGQTWARVATDATTPYTGVLTGIMSVCQDATNGAIHFAMYNTSGVTNARGYGRATFTTSGGHITGYTWAATPFVLTTHTASSLDPRGQIIPVTRAGSEYLLYHISLGNSTTVTTYYTGLSSSLTPSSSASFVGIDNTGSDTQTVNLTDAGTFGANHSLISVMVQDPTTEDLYLVMGFQFTGDLLNNTGSASSNLWFKQLARSGSYWTAPTSTTAGTTIVGDNGSIVPTLMNVYPAPGLGAYVMAGTPASGVQFYTLTGGTAAVIAGSPSSTANKGGLGAFSVDASGRIYCVFVTMILNDASPTAFEAYFDGTKWKSFSDGGADCVGMGGTVPWTYGVAVIQELGSSVAQTNTGAFAASIFNSSPIIISQPEAGAAAVGGTVTYSVTAVALSGSLSYQWKLNGSNVGTNSSSYTTAALGSGDNGGTVTVDVTDSIGTTTSLPARLWVSGLASATKGVNFPGWAYARIQRGLPSALHLARSQFGAGLHSTTQASQVAFNDWYFGTPAGGAAALAATPQAQATLAGGLTTAIKAAAVLAAAATLTATLTVPKPVAATPSAVATLSGVLTTSIQAAAAPSAIATLTGGLSTGIVLAATPSNSATLDGSLTTGIPLAATPAGVSTVTGAISTQIKLASAPGAVATLAADLTAGAAFGASPAAVSTLTGSLTTAIQLAATPSGVSTLTADITTGGGGAALAATPQAQATLSGALTTGIALAAPAGDQATLSGSLSTQIVLAATPAAVSTLGASLTTGSGGFSTSPAAIATLTGSLTTAIKLAATPGAQATLTGALGGTAAQMAATPSSSSTLAGQLTTGIVLGGTPTAQATITASLTTAIRLAAAPASQATLGATLYEGALATPERTLNVAGKPRALSIAASDRSARLGRNDRTNA